MEIEENNMGIYEREKYSEIKLPQQQQQMNYEDYKLGIESKLIYYLGKSFYIAFTQSKWSFENYIRVEEIVFDQKTAVGWGKMKRVFEGMINQNLKKNQSFEKIIVIIEEIYKKKENSDNQENLRQASQGEQQISKQCLQLEDKINNEERNDKNLQFINLESQENNNQSEEQKEIEDKKQIEKIIINEKQKEQEILPSVIPILPSVIPQSPPNRKKKNIDQEENNIMKNKTNGVQISIKEDRSMCKIHLTQPIILICNVCHKLLCIKCLNQHEQHPESTEADQYQSLELLDFFIVEFIVLFRFIKNELQNQQTINKLKQISLDYNCKIKEFQKKVQLNVINFENTFIENLKKTLIDQIDRKKMELIGYLKQNQYECIEELIKSNEELTDSMNSINWLFKNFDMVEDVNDVYKFNEFYEIIQKVQLSKVYAEYDKIINSVNERVKELSSQMIMQLLKQFFDNLQRLNPEEAGKINQQKINLPQQQAQQFQQQQTKFKYSAKEAEMNRQQEQQLQQQFPVPKSQDISGKKRNFEKFKSFKTVAKDNQGKDAIKGNGTAKQFQFNPNQQKDVINIDDEDEQTQSNNSQSKRFQFQQGYDEETKKRNELIQKYKERKNEINQANNKLDDELHFNFAPKKNVHLEQSSQLTQFHQNSNNLQNNENPIIAEINRKRQQLEDELQELKELQVHAVETQPIAVNTNINAGNFHNFSGQNEFAYEQQQQQGQQGENAKKGGGRKARVNTCGHPDLPHKSLGKCAKCYSAYRKSLKANSKLNVNSMQDQFNPQYYQENKLFSF